MGGEALPDRRSPLLDGPFAIDVEQQRGIAGHCARVRRGDRRLAHFVQLDGHRKPSSNSARAVLRGELRVARSAAGSRSSPPARASHRRGARAAARRPPCRRGPRARCRALTRARGGGCQTVRRYAAASGFQSGEPFDVDPLLTDGDWSDHVTATAAATGAAAGIRERLAPADEPFVGLNAHEADVEAFPAPAAQLPARGAVLERDGERNRLDAGDFHC